MATLSSIITPTNITTASNTQTLTNKTLTGAAMNGTLGATTPSTVAATTLAVSSTSSFTTSAPSVVGGFYRNRVINGDMLIDQQNAGAAVTLSSATNQRMVDKFIAITQATSTGTMQQVTDAPTGFSNSLKYTVATAVSPAAGNFNQLTYAGEISDIRDWNIGTANAATATVSFWVKSSLTGTFGFVMDNNPGSPRNYLATYAISSANTWEQKTITIALDTTAGWTSGTPPKFRFIWDLGSGTTLNGTAGVWGATNYRRTSACVILVNNTAATWQLTGVQFEIGTAASAFEFKPIQQQLAMCQRYFEKSETQGTAILTASRDTGGCIVPNGTVANTVTYCVIKYKVEKASVVTPVVYPYTNTSTTNCVSNSSAGTDLAANSGYADHTTTSGFAITNSSGSTIDVSANCRALFNWYCDTGF